ncbi:MAG: RNA polymerase sigma factor [Pseudomonadota bacterium]
MVAAMGSAAESGLKAVFLAERPMLARLLSARLGGPDDAEDALQDMWLKLDQFVDRPVADPAAYLFRMAANLAADRRLSAVRRGARDTGWVETQSEADDIPDIERTLIARERLRQVQAALAALPERTQMAFRMFRLEGRPQREIGAELGISVSGVEKLLQRAYRQIHDSGGEKGAGLTEP